MIFYFQSKISALFFAFCINGTSCFKYSKQLLDFELQYLNAPTIHREDKKNEPNILYAQKITRESKAQSLSSTEKSFQFKERYKHGSKNKKYLIIGSVAIVLGFVIWSILEANKKKSLPDLIREKNRYGIQRLKKMIH